MNQPQSRFVFEEHLSDLNKSIMMEEEALRLTLDGHPGRPGRLSSLSHSLFHHFEQLGDLSDLNKSIMILEQAVELTPDGHPEQPAILSNLGNLLFCRFKHLGNLNDLNKSIMIHEHAVTVTPDGHPEKPAMLSNFGNSLLHCFKQLGDLSDLTKSIMMLKNAITVAPNDHPDKPRILNNLGNSLFCRFEQLDDLGDLNESIIMVENAVQLTPDGHLDRPGRLNNLGNLLLGCFERLGDLSNLNKSIMMFEDAVQLTPDGHSSKLSLLNNLGRSLLSRFERLGDLDDLNQSILRLETAVTLSPDGHPGKPSLLNSLGLSLLSRFELLSDVDDINQSILRLAVAVALIPDGNPGKPSLLNSLGKSLLSRFELLRDLDDINQSVLWLEAAVALTPDGHPSKPSFLNNLGNSLVGRFEQLHNPQDAQKLLLHFTLAACSATGPASIRFLAAKKWAEHAHIHESSSILHAYTTAIELLPELAWLGLSISDRRHHLLQAGQVVRDAASAAIAVHDYQKAVEWLEQGRSVVWGQLVCLRTPVDELRQIHPSLADKLVYLSTCLETTGWRNAVVDSSKPLLLQSIAQQSHAFALERNHLLQKIRNLAGFQRFLLPKPISELVLAAKVGPVAILNISEYGCDALILMPGFGDEVIHVPLHDFTLLEAQLFAKALGSIEAGYIHRLKGDSEGPRRKVPDDIFSQILSELWFKIVQPVLKGIAITTPSHQDLARIWWCPTGPLTLLPIHAAGLYGEHEVFGSKLSDFLISSYTPSLAALIQAFRPQSQPQKELQLLIVTDEQNHYPGIKAELRCIQQHAAGKVRVMHLEKDRATVKNVQEGMVESRWVHFACSSVPSASSTENALLLAGGSRFTLSDIFELSLPNADLAFLSACETAAGSKELPDESVHLAAGMLIAGYRGVIGTMWSIGDTDAAQVASDVYAHLLKVSPPDPTRAAEALHLAVQELRKQPNAKSFLHWLPFIHFGA
ncbi:CHAT domain-containing protein [Mycena galopus ATCC 62051]|nr:CHAT domain-containing protein [Mycena galopus ATCC 62051]